MRPEIKTFVLLIPGLSSYQYLVFRWLYPARKSKINGSGPYDSKLKVGIVNIRRGSRGGGQGVDDPPFEKRGGQ